MIASAIVFFFSLGHMHFVSLKRYSFCRSFSFIILSLFCVRDWFYEFWYQELNLQSCQFVPMIFLNFSFGLFCRKKIASIYIRFASVNDIGCKVCWLFCWFSRYSALVILCSVSGPFVHRYSFSILSSFSSHSFSVISSLVALRCLPHVLVWCNVKICLAMFGLYRLSFRPRFCLPQVW